MSIIPALGSLRMEDCKPQDNLGLVARAHLKKRNRTGQNRSKKLDAKWRRHIGKCKIKEIVHKK
jgi:hypothetical protein